MSYDEYALPQLSRDEFKSFSDFVRPHNVGWCNIERAWVYDPSDCCSQLPGYRLWRLFDEWARTRGQATDLDPENQKIVFVETK